MTISQSDKCVSQQGHSTNPPVTDLSEWASQGHSPALRIDERVRLMRDGVINYLQVFVSGLVGVLLIPIMLRGLGSELYGLWVATLAVAAMTGALNFGLSASVTREVAARRAETSDETVRFVVSAGNAYLAFGLVGALVIGSLGLPLSRSLHLLGESLKIAPAVFMLTGFAFCADQLVSFSTALLSGLRRFDTTNLVLSGAVLVRAAGIVALLALGAGLLSVAMWNAVVSAATAFAAHAVVERLEPRFRLDIGHFDWNSMRAHMRFGLASQLSVGTIEIVWNMPSLLIGVVLGSSSIVPYYIGQKFAWAVAGVSWRAAEVLFPAASEQQRSGNVAYTRETLEVGTRWIVLLTLPLCLILWILAPNLLQAWLGVVRPDAVLVLRLMTVAVLADAVGVGALHILWGRGAAETVLVVLVGVAAATLGLNLGLLSYIGVAGAAWGMLIPMAFGSLAFLALASHVYRIELPNLARAISSGLLLPVIACVATTSALTRLLRPDRWAGVIGTALAAGVAYAVSLYWGGARTEERQFAQQTLGLFAGIVRPVYLWLRRLLRQVGFLRSGWYLTLALIDLLRYSPERVRAWFDQEFQQLDPWGFATASGQRYHQRATEMLDSARGDARFRRAVEIGCAEGAFTELLAARCESVLAVDISPVALARARERCRRFEHVQFGDWDLRQDPAPGVFDLVLVMDVLDCFYRPGEMRAARCKILDLLARGGYLLVSNTRQSEVFENAWWARHLIRGGKWISAFFAQDPALQPIETITDDLHMYTLFQKCL